MVKNKTRRGLSVKKVRRRSQRKQKYRKFKGGSETVEDCMNEKCVKDDTNNFNPTHDQLKEISDNTVVTTLESMSDSFKDAWKINYKKALKKELIAYAKKLGLDYTEAQYDEYLKCYEENLEDCVDQYGRKSVKDLIARYERKN
jgi:hypothetical protein